MPNDRENIDRHYASRLDQLRDWHVLTAVCGTCKRRVRMRPQELAARNLGHIHPHDLATRLVCRHCGGREGNRVYVTLARRD